MANKKISDLAAAGAAVGTDMIEIETNAGASRKQTLSAIWSYFSSLLGGAITASGYTMGTNKLLGRTTASTGAIEQITVGTGLVYSGGTLRSAIITGAASGNDPNPVSIPAASSFTWLNQDTAAISDTQFGILLTNAVNSEWHILEQDAPSAPFDVYLRMDTFLLEASSTNVANACAISLRDGAGGATANLVLLACERILRAAGTDYRLRFSRWDDTGTFNADILASRTTDPRIWLRVRVTSTQITPYILFAGQWVQVASPETITTHVGAVTKVGFAMRSDTGIDAAYAAVGNFGFVDPLA